MRSHPAVCTRPEFRVLNLLRQPEQMCLATLRWPADLTPAKAATPHRDDPASSGPRRQRSRMNATLQPPARNCSDNANFAIGGTDPSGAFAIASSVDGQRLLAALVATSRLRFVLMLREPLQRAHSAFEMAARRSFRGTYSYASLDECVRTEARWMLQPKVEPPVRFNRYMSAMDTLRHGLYSAQLDALRAGGIDPLGARLLVVISEQLQASPAHELSRIWRFLGVASVPTISTFDRKGEYKQTMSRWAELVLYAYYRNSTQHVFATLYDGQPIPEWEAFYQRRGLGKGASITQLLGNDPLRLTVTV